MSFELLLHPENTHCIGFSTQIAKLPFYQDISVMIFTELDKLELAKLGNKIRCPFDSSLFK